MRAVSGLTMHIHAHTCSRTVPVPWHPSILYRAFYRAGCRRSRAPPPRPNPNPDPNPNPNPNPNQAFKGSSAKGLTREGNENRDAIE
eukprot:scaffold55296_cov39-Phaeocystis_antarctica.AAC.1